MEEKRFRYVYVCVCVCVCVCLFVGHIVKQSDVK